MLEIFTNIIIAVISSVVTLIVAIISTRERTDAFLQYLKEHRFRITAITFLFLMLLFGLPFLGQTFDKEIKNQEDTFLDRYDEKVEDIVRLKDKLSQLNVKNDSLQIVNRLLITQRDSIENLLTLKQNQKDDLTQRIDQKETEKRRLNVLLQKMDPLKVDQIDSLKLIINQLESEILKLMSEKDLLGEAIEKLKIEKEDLNQKNEDLMNSLEKSNRERQILEMRLNERRHIYTTKTNQSDSIISHLPSEPEYFKLTHQIAWSSDKKWLAILYSSGKTSRLLVVNISSRTEILDSLIQKNYQQIKFLPNGDNILLDMDLLYLKKQVNTVKTICLCSQPRTLSYDEVKDMLKKYDFYCREYSWCKAYCNPTGRGFMNKYKIHLIQGDRVILDQSSGLMWQYTGSNCLLYRHQVQSYIDSVNQVCFAGYSNWRLPTLEESMSLMEPRKNQSGYYVDECFNHEPFSVWTVDRNADASRSWVVSFYYGSCSESFSNDYDYVRLVRSGHSLSGR